jgi:AcrR family transcriptional regulator
MTLRTTVDVDGRTARATRTRQAVVTALLALLEEGRLRPSAAEIAARAKVSLRSVFQHFEDMESLYAAVADAQMERLASLVSREDGAGPLGQRLDAFIERRTALLERITPVRRASLLQEPFSGEVARRLRAAHEIARDEVERTFAPELARAAPGERARLVFALDVATNWSAWDTSRRLNGLSITAAARVMKAMVKALLKEVSQWKY